MATPTAKERTTPQSGGRHRLGVGGLIVILCMLSSETAETTSEARATLRIWTCGACTLNRWLGLTPPDVSFTVEAQLPNPADPAYRVYATFHPVDSPDAGILHFDTEVRGQAIVLRVPHTPDPLFSSNVHGKIHVKERVDFSAKPTTKEYPVQIVFFPSIAAMLALFLSTHLMVLLFPRARGYGDDLESIRRTLLAAWRLALLGQTVLPNKDGELDAGLGEIVKYCSDHVERSDPHLATLKAWAPTRDNIKNCGNIRVLERELERAMTVLPEPSRSGAPHFGFYATASLGSLVGLVLLYTRTTIPSDFLKSVGAAIVLGGFGPIFARRCSSLLAVVRRVRAWCKRR